MPLSKHATIARTDDLLAAPIEQDLVILSQTSDHYIALDPIGRKIWDLLQTPQRVDVLCQQLSQYYAASPEQISADVLPFLNDLVQEGLIYALGEATA